MDGTIPVGVEKVEDWTNATKEEYDTARQRLEACKKLLSFVGKERASGGLFEFIEDPAVQSELEAINVWFNGTTAQYKEKLDLIFLARSARHIFPYFLGQRKSRTDYKNL